MYNNQRDQMVDQQVRTWDVLDPAVLDVMQSTPRENFLPEKLKNFSNSDVALNIRTDFQLPSPSVQGKILQALDINDDDAIYQLGAGCGYLSACLSQLGGHLNVSDTSEEELNKVQNSCTALNISNLSTQHATWAEGLQVPEKKYDLIVSQYAFQKIPGSLEKALKINGRAVLFEGQSPIISCIKVVRIGDNEWLRESLFETELKAYPQKTNSSFSF